MMNLCSELLMALDGRTFSTAESCTGGGVGAAFTAVSGSSSVYKGGIISYCNDVKHSILGVDSAVLAEKGAVSKETAIQMAVGVRALLKTDMAVSVTGIAGPGTDELSAPVGLVYIGFTDGTRNFVKCCYFEGDRESVRKQSTEAALKVLIDECRADR